MEHVSFVWLYVNIGTKLRLEDDNNETIPPLSPSPSLPLSLTRSTTTTTKKHSKTMQPNTCHDVNGNAHTRPLTFSFPLILFFVSSFLDFLLADAPVSESTDQKAKKPGSLSPQSIKGAMSQRFGYYFGQTVINIGDIFFLFTQENIMNFQLYIGNFTSTGNHKKIHK